MKLKKEIKKRTYTDEFKVLELEPEQYDEIIKTLGLDVFGYHHIRLTLEVDGMYKTFPFGTKSYKVVKSNKSDE